MKRPRKEPARQTSTSLLLPVRGGLIKRNQGILRRSILAVVQVIYAPTCLREGGTRYFVGRFLFERRMVSEAGEFFGRRRTWNIIFQERCKRFVTPYVLRLLITISPKPDWFKGAAKVRRHEAMGAAGMNGRQGTPWREELDGKKFHGAAWWRVRSGVERIRFFLYTKSAAGASTALPSIYKCGIMLVLKGVVFLRDPLYCCTVPQYLAIVLSLFRELCFCYTKNRVVFDSSCISQPRA